jgi:hypothetical protein
MQTRSQSATLCAKAEECCSCCSPRTPPRGSHRENYHFDASAALQRTLGVLTVGSKQSGRILKRINCGEKLVGTDRLDVPNTASAPLASLCLCASATLQRTLGVLTVGSKRSAGILKRNELW